MKFLDTLKASLTGLVAKVKSFFAGLFAKKAAVSPSEPTAPAVTTPTPPVGPVSPVEAPAPVTDPLTVNTPEGVKPSITELMLEAGANSNAKETLDQRAADYKPTDSTTVDEGVQFGLANGYHKEFAGSINWPFTAIDGNVALFMANDKGTISAVVSQNGVVVGKTYGDTFPLVAGPAVLNVSSIDGGSASFALNKR